MAQQIVRTCDQPVGGRPCGRRVPENRPTTLSLNGEAWEADLCAEHQSPLTKMVSDLAPILRSVQDRPLPERRMRSGNYRKRHEAGAVTFTAADVRAWLASQGVDVPPSGRLKEEYMADFVEAQVNDGSTPPGARQRAPR